MNGGGSGSINQNNTTGNIINKSVAVLSSHQMSKKSVHTPTTDGPLLDKYRGFTETYKNVQQGFLRAIYGRANKRMKETGHAPDSLLEYLRNNSNWVDGKSFEKHYTEIIETSEIGSQKEKMLLPYKRDMPFFEDGGLIKLRNLIIIAINNSDTTQYLDDELLEKACFTQLTDRETRSWRINSRNVNHLPDDSNTQELNEKFNEFWKGETVESEVIGATKAILLMQCLNDFEFEDTAPPGLNLKEYFDKTLDEYRRQRADSGTTQNHIEIIKRIEHLKWGPKEYKRDPERVEAAMNVLHGGGVMALRGWGGVGKTALATRMIFDAAKKQTFDRYITSSTKVGGSQKEQNIHQAGGPTLVESDENTTIFDSLLSRDKKIGGSIRRLCIQIIRSASGNIRKHDGSTVLQLIDAAIDCMKEHKMLICIDNFEDIEEPVNLEFTDVRPEDLLNESKNFKIFFDKWTQNYQALRKNDAAAVFSQVIVTTRSKGIGAAPYDVPYLTDDENFKLFKFKIETRIAAFREKGISSTLTPETLVTLDQNKDKINQHFSEWKYVDKDTIINGVHPMNTISAAVEVTKNDLEHILATIDDWDPLGKKAKEIAEYCASKVFASLEPLERAIITELILRKSNFTRHEIITIANEWIASIPGATETFGHDEAHRFLQTYNNERDWFENSPNNPTLYRWKPQVYTHVIRREEVAKEFKARKEMNSLDKKNQESPTYDATARKNLYEWINADEARKPRELNALLKPLLKEKNLNEEQIASGYIMLFGKDFLKKPKKESDDPNDLAEYKVKRRRFAKVERLFDGHTPIKAMIEIITDYNREKTKKAAGKEPRSSELSSGIGFVSTEKGLALTSGLTTFIKYVSRIQEEFNRILINNDSYGVCLHLYSDMIKKFVKYHGEELFPSDSVIKTYQFVLKQLLDLPEREIYDAEVYNQMVQDFINEVSSLMKIVPGGVGHSFNLTAEFLEVCKLIVRAGSEMFEMASGGHEDTCGSIYWAAMHALANIESGDPFANLAIDMLEEHYTNGRAITKNVLNVNMFQIYHNRVTRAKKQLFWTIEELMTPSGAQFGTLGKIVFMDVAVATNHDNVEIVFHEETGAQQRLEIEKECIFFRVVNHTVHRLYVSPILDENGEPVVFEELIGFDEVKKAVTEIIASIEIAVNPVSWNEMKQLISSHLDYDPWLSLSHYDSERNAVMEFRRLINRDDLVLKNIQEHIYLKIGEFTPQDIAKLKKHGYEKQFPSDYSQITASKKDRKGHSWPRNPVMMARIVHEFTSKTDNDSSMTFQQMKNHVKNKLGETDSDVRHHVIEDFFNAMDEGYDGHWSQRPINFKHIVYKDSKTLISAIEDRAHHRCTTYSGLKGKPKAKELVSFYLESVNSEYSKIFKK